MTGLPPRSAELHGVRVLVVEDEFLVSMDIEHMLRDLGCQVVGPLGSIDKALAAARDTPLDVAVLDLNIGGEPVLPVADALAAQAVPFVFCTGYDAQSLPAEYAAALALMKPFQMDDLRDALLSTLSGQRRAAPE